MKHVIFLDSTEQLSTLHEPTLPSVVATFWGEKKSLYVTKSDTSTSNGPNTFLYLWNKISGSPPKQLFTKIYYLPSAPVLPGEDKGTDKAKWRSVSQPSQYINKKICR